MLVLVDLAELAVSVILTDTTANIPRTSQITGFGGLGEKAEKPRMHYQGTVDKHRGLHAGFTVLIMIWEDGRMVI